MSATRCTHCGAVDTNGRAGWLCRTCGTMLPSDRPDGKATAIAAKVARDLGCADIDDVPDALKRVLGDNADAEIHRRVLGQQANAQRTRADAAEQECAQLRTDRDYWHAQATAAAPCVDAVRSLTVRLIDGGTGCVVDPERVVAAEAATGAALDAWPRANEEASE